MNMKKDHQAQYVRNMKLSIVTIENILIELKKESRVSMKHFKHIRDICDAQLRSFESRKKGDSI